MQVSKAVVFSILVALLPGATQAESSGDFAEYREQARSVTDELGGQLMSRLQAALADGGPGNAISVCRDQAPAIKTALSLERGWEVSRVGTRVRNSLLGTPDAWEREVLERFRQRHEEGAPFGEMEHAEVVTEGEERYFRYMRPIGVKGLCLNCHGDREQMDAAVVSEIEQRYPHDRAYGYEVGDLRGAFSVKAPLPAE